MLLSDDAGEGGNARGAATWADTRGSSGERRLLLQPPHSMVSKGPGPGPESVRENRATGIQLAARSRPKKLSGALRVRRRRPREEG